MSSTSLYQRLQSCLQQDIASFDDATGAGKGQAAVLMALSDAAEPELLLIRRSLQLPTHPGEIALPGGKVDPGDVDLRATALREAWEEVALPERHFQFCGNLTPRTSMMGLSVTAVVGIIPIDLALRADAGEVDELIRVPLRFFAQADNLRTDRVMRGGNYRLAARYQYLHYTIWGITAAFIVELVNRLYASELDVAAHAKRIYTD